MLFFVRTFEGQTGLRWRDIMEASWKLPRGPAAIWVFWFAWNLYVVKRYNKPTIPFIVFNSPPARWGLLDFIRAVLLLLVRLLRLLCLLLTRRLLLAVQIPVGTAGPPPRAPDPSGHCRTSTASCRSQWVLPDLNHDFQVAVGTAGLQPRAPDPSGHCRTSTASS